MGIHVTDRGSFLTVQPFEDGTRLDHVPAAVYKLFFHPEIGIRLLKDRSRFSLPEKKYGKHAPRFNAITSQYDRLNPSMGVLLVGNKGSGKSMLAEDLCNWGIDAGLPVLVVDKNYGADIVRSAILSMGACVVLFDEFGKVYPEQSDSQPDRSDMLTLFSDTQFTGILFLLTANGEGELNDYMLNRPGRFMYRIDYQPLDGDTAVEIAQNQHVDESLHRMFRYYAAGWRDGVNFDTVIRMAKVARGCKTLDDLEAGIEILNIPRLHYPMYNLKRVTFRGVQQSQREFIIDKMMDDELHFEVLDSEGETVAKGSGLLLPSLGRRLSGPKATDRRQPEVGVWQVAMMDGEVVVEFDIGINTLRHTYDTSFRSEREIQVAQEAAEAHQAEMDARRLRTEGGNPASAGSFRHAGMEHVGRGLTRLAGQGG